MICLYHFWETVPKQEKYEDITVMDVQFVQSKLQIITQNDVISNNEKNTDEIHLYTIDLAGKKIISDETLLSETFDSSNEGHFAMPSKVDEGKANNVLVLALVKGSYIEEEGFKEKKGESSLFALELRVEDLLVILFIGFLKRIKEKGNSSQAMKAILLNFEDYF